MCLRANQNKYNEKINIYDYVEEEVGKGSRGRTDSERFVFVYKYIF